MCVHLQRVFAGSGFPRSRKSMSKPCGSMNTTVAETMGTGRDGKRWRHATVGVGEGPVISRSLVMVNRVAVMWLRMGGSE